MKHPAVLVLCLLLLGGLGFAQQKPVLKETPKQKEERLRWWREARFGMFIHWGPVSLKGTEISWSRGGERRSPSRSMTISTGSLIRSNSMRRSGLPSPALRG
jgi:hypothetical protein